MAACLLLSPLWDFFVPSWLGALLAPESIMNVLAGGK